MKLLTLLSCISMVATVPLAALAQDATSTLPSPTAATGTEMLKRHIGLFGGTSNPTDTDYDNSNLVALDFGFQPYIPFSLGAEILREDFDSDDQKDISRTQLMFKASYNFGGDIPVIKYSYIGIGIGMVNEDRTGSSPTYGAIMPNLGFDIPVGGGRDYISLGLNARYTASTSDEADSSSLAGVVKYWF